jgi:Rieske Fe-S protein
MSDAREPAPGADPTDFVQLGRRDVIRKAGGWVIYVGVLASAGSVASLVSCGRTPLGDPFGGDGPNPTPDGTPTPTGTNPTPTPTGFDPCDCSVPGGINLGIKTTAIPVNSVAYNSGYKIFVCHEGGTTNPGFYIMTSICPHQLCDIGTQGTFSTTNLGNGFHCNCHGSGFQGDGAVSNGPAAVALNHFQMAVDAGTKDIYLLSKNPPFPDITCRCPG